MASSRLIIVSNRLPVTVHVEGDAARIEQSSGGLATGLRGPHERSGGLWIGWPGNLDSLDDRARREVDRQMRDAHLVPVSLSEHEQRIFYGNISNAVLWPLCHDRIDQMPLEIEGWDVYERVNEHFADAVVANYRPGDTIWVHDYQLLRLPALLRQRLPDARIGFFLHIPFPTPEIFFVLPVRRWLLEGMLGADVIGFHTRRFRGHFTAALRRLFGIEPQAGTRFEWQGRTVAADVFPMGVDAAHFAERAVGPEVNAERMTLRHSTMRLVVGVDRLDYSKGMPRRLLAFEQLLRRHPEWRERVHFIQVAVPSRGEVSAYRRYRKDVHALVGRINGDHATPTWTPVNYLYRSLPEHTLLALYRAADVMLVTPMRDGMNLVAKEFVASRIDEEGVLVLSEFAGAADELTDALIVNPYDVAGVADALHQALTMPGVERRNRMRSLRSHVFAHDVHEWAGRFLSALQGEPPESLPGPPAEARARRSASPAGGLPAL